MVEAGARAAAHRAELEAQRKEAALESELRKLEFEEQRRRSEAEDHIQKLKNKVNQQKTEKLIRIEEARLQVYTDADEEEHEDNGNHTDRRSSMHQAHAPVSDMKALADAITSSISMSRIPAPEPPVFDGDPLQYHDWCVSLRTLIEERGIDERDKIHYLKRYVSGAAKEAISGFFLLKGDSAYSKAKRVLQERYGDEFIVSEAFRDKLDTWPKISGRDTHGLQKFSDFLNQCSIAKQEMSGLQILDDNRENRKLLQKLPEWLVRRWSRIVANEKKQTGRYPSFKTFSDFIAEEARIACEPCTSLPVMKRDDKAKRSTLPKGTTTLMTSVEKCTFCEKPGHGITVCRSFTSKDVSEKQEFIKKKGLCYGCLNPGHISKSCKQRATCTRCQKRHPTSLHEDRPLNTKENVKEREADVKASEEPTAATCKSTSNGSKSITSMTVPVWLSSKSYPNKEILVYALLDTQSDTTFISDETLDSLDVTSTDIKLLLTTMSSTDTLIKSRKVSNLQVRSFNGPTRITLPTAYSRSYIPLNRAQIPSKQTAERWSHLHPIVDKIPELQNCDIGLLIGCDCARALLQREILEGKEGEPIGIKTDLGWAVVGGTSAREFKETAVTHRAHTREVPPDICTGRREVNFMARFKTKEMPDTCPLLLDYEENDDEKFSQDDILFLNQMELGIKQDEDGHFSMPLPFKRRPNLPQNKHTAERRYDHLRRKMNKNPEFRKDYENFINGVIERGEAEKVPNEEIDKPSWYIPHHGVYHPKKPDKLRVVFDCSAQCSGTSLNSHLLQGPDMTNKLVGVLLRFRREHVAIMCDIEKMFHQFRVHVEDRNFLRFIWNDADYRMKVHLFGATSSPACANYALKYIANINKDSHEEAANFIDKNFYVDDGLTSVANIEQAKKLIKETKEICASGGLRLHKFVSNRREIMDALPSDERGNTSEKRDMIPSGLGIERALGIQWNLVSDVFCFQLSLKHQSDTKRGILTTIASIYDPLGFLAPFLLKGKQILQELCRRKVDWDDPLPPELKLKWNSWKADLQNLCDVEVNRCMKPSNMSEIKTAELHHFADASTTGLGACSYLRLIDRNGMVHCSLVMGKSRVSPMKITTVPRLELQAAVLATKLSCLINKELNLPDCKNFFWTDSNVVVGYLNNDAKRFHVYVANRIQYIKERSSPEQWYHVDSKKNPADHASRGISVKNLQDSNWLKGPEFLWNPKLNIQKTEDKGYILDTEDPEVKTSLLVKSVKSKTTMLERFERFSKWKTLVKAISRIQCCITRKRSSDPVKAEQYAERTIIKIIQDSAFKEELKSLETDKEIKKGSSLAKLDPFVDDDGIIRVGGRLHLSSISSNLKHPIILPQKSHASRLIAQHYHDQIGHQGRSMTMNKIRQNGFWIVGLSKVVSTLIHRCVNCRKLRGTTETQKMASLPPERTEEAPPFTYCGFDCFGPFIVKEGRKELKRYGLLFSCMNSRGVHIELLDDMTSDAFINALRCFISIRGPVRRLFSDRGSNFIGAERQLREELEKMKDPLKRFLQGKQCEFVFNTPSSSHMGGVWERQIRTIRSILNGLMNQHPGRLDTASLRTLFCEVMAIINCRPLTVENENDPMSPLPLSPNNLLTMKTDVVLPPPGEFVKEDVYTRKRWRKVQHVANEFWQRWRKEFLSQLQTRQRWNQTERNFEIGDVVLFKEENPIRNQWQLARVIETYKGRDNLVRKVKLLMSDSRLDKNGKRLHPVSQLERPIHKLVLLMENHKETTRKIMPPEE
jgi:hypothetical protein